MVNSQLPPAWPASLTMPTNAKVIEVDLNGYQRYVLMKPTTIALLGGELLTGLKKNGWDVSSVGTPRTATLVARRDGESVTMLIRDQANGPAWSSVEVIYQAEAPPFPEPSPSPSPAPGDLTKRA